MVNQSMTDEIKLKPQYQKFADAYLRLFNATKAAIEAGYSADSAHVTGCRLLKDANIKAYIHARMEESAMTSGEVLHHLAEIARGNIEDVVDRHGNLDMPKAMETGKSRNIKRIKNKSITTEDSDISETETEVYDRLRALELLGKYHVLFTEKQQLSGVDGDAIQIVVKRTHGNQSETD